MSNDIIIKNGTIMDGTGEPAFKSDLIIREDRIEGIRRVNGEKASIVIDAKGLVIAPGFIDVHSHLDFLFPSSRHAQVLETWARQGVTTIVSGNCGYSPAPINHDREDLINRYWNFACPHDGLKYEWTTMAEFFEYLEKNGLAFNLAMLTGHNTLRTNVMGFEARFADPEEIAEMKRMLKESLDAGSIGLSLGLAYCPGIFSKTDEIMELASVMTDYGTPLVPHTRGTVNKLYVKAVEEVITIAEKNKIPLHISHHGEGGIGRTRKLVREAINEAIKRDVKISHDNIPFPNSSTTVLKLFPPWLFNGGIDKFFERLKDLKVREQIKQEMKSVALKWPPWQNNYWTDKLFSVKVYLCGFRNEKNLKFNNMTIGDISKELNKEPIDTLIDLVLNEGAKLFTIGGPLENPMAEDFVNGLLSDPNCSIGTDIVGADFKTISPAAYGAFTKVLGQIARDKRIMTQEEAVRKMTYLPAQQMQLKNRGVLKKAAFADITVFDPKKVICRASYINPYQPSDGIEYVIINGKIVIEKAEYNSKAFAGKVIKRTSN